MQIVIIEKRRSAVFSWGLRCAMTDDEIDKGLDNALYQLAVGVTVDELGKDKDGKSKIFKRKLAPNLEAIKYLKEQRKKNQGSRKYEPSIIPMQKGLDNDC